ncbi:MAG: hypothetical protein Q4D74_06635 [Comamonadaceae bacterium]|nr:hypothetical protein [Comamonadaceae bacterium]
MKKFKSQVPPSERVSLGGFDSQAIDRLFKLVDSCKTLNRCLSVLEDELKRLDGHAVDLLELSRGCLFSLLSSYMAELDALDDRDFFKDAQKPMLEVPPLVSSIDDLMRYRVDFYRRIDALRSEFVRMRGGQS